MDNTEFKKIVQEITSKYGFMYCKKNYYCYLHKIIIIYTPCYIIFIISQKPLFTGFLRCQLHNSFIIFHVFYAFLFS